ncbi:uncharacterized protein LOC124140967 [Haliotis rufescens]|uniref:uncharacterized protein LOC124140967 n=1 Tax=Haliotis rufescens TaxID=6454 RepID=UPI00201EDBD7|nr:uncharacterized protein LOC124140967 [Haliotis rufescens]XP_046364770.2 uncharacterized protein LOC124140967 [Haliotis rufescens]XP_046364771.2 uncharacterized protein LOC124140967 [Haliotis rufescens]
MAFNTTDIPTLQGEYSSPLNSVLIMFTVVGVVLNFASALVKLLLKFAMPHTWKLSCLLLDVSHFILGLGLALLLCYIRFQAESLCKAAGFFLMVGVLDSVSVYLISNVIILFVQYPEKLSGYSHYPKWTIPAMLVPEKAFTLLLALFPFLPIHYFNDNDDPYVITCLPVRETNAKGAGYGAALMFISWIVLSIAVIVCMVTTFRLWKSSGGRIHASSPNIWQMMMLSQGKTYQRFLLLEQLVWMVVLFMTTVIIYTNTSRLLVPQWIAVVALSVSTFFHAVLSNIVTILWSTLCCRTKQQTKEPYQKLKKLELLKIEAPGKLRMKATWSVGKGVYRRGLLKVYGVDHLKAWAQEIVILGMMRKTQSASLLQCLWTNSGNPYFETMTLITGEIIPGESRLICFEFTNSGTLDDFLHHLDIPLPEPCQRTIIHDIAEGLSCLHKHNILHHKLTSASVFLKGSVQCMVLRAALGDFEAAQIYGSLQGGSSSSSQVSKKQFFLPDIRAFALVALEIIGYVCKKREDEKQPFRKTRSEIVISSQKSGNPKSRESVQDLAHKSRSLDERAILGETGLNNIPPFGSLVNVKEVDPHPNVPEEQDAWAQPVTSVRITGKLKDAGQSEHDHLSRHATDDGRWLKGSVPCKSPKGYARETPTPVFRAEPPLYEHDYEEIEEITEQIQRDQIVIQQIRYPRKDDNRSDERSWRDYPSGAHYSVPADVSNPRFIDQTQKPNLPNRNAVGGGGVFFRSDPLRYSASSVSTLEDIEEHLPEVTEGGEHVAATLKDLWLKKEADKKERLLTSYNERMKKELKDVFSRRNRKRKDQGVSREAVQEISRPLSARSYHDNGTTVVPFSGGEKETHFGDSRQKRPQTARPAQRQMSEGSGKPVPRRPAPPPPPRPVTAAATTRPQTPSHGIKKAQARTKLKRVLGQKQSSVLTNANLNNTRGQGASIVEMKYASVKKIPQIKDSFKGSEADMDCERLPPPRPQTVHPKPPKVGHFSSFSSNDSLGSSFYKHSPRKADVSLTSGELTSLSSQAETTLPEHDVEDVIELPPTYETKGAQKGGKIIDSGFDSASIASENSCDVSMVDERSCSCPSGSYTTDTCSCQCSITPTSGMHTKPLYDRRTSWSKTDSFSSYDSTDLDQKLERLRNGDVRPSKDVIGPDEQYPMMAAKPKIAHPTQCSPHQNRKHLGKVVTKTQRTRRHDFGSASKRYKELRKKGIPLRVSVVSSASSQDVSDATDWDSYMESTAEVIEEEDDSVVDDNDDAIFNALDSQGVFEPSDTDSSMGVRPLHHTRPVAVVHGTKRPRDTDNRTNAMILEDIIRELPDEITGASSMDDETQSFLHHSEPKAEFKDEEEIVDMAIEIPYKPSSVVDAELVIDRLFTKRNTLKHKGSLQDVMDPILGFDENLIRELASPTSSSGRQTDLPVQMLKGVTKTHVQACKELSSKVPLVPFSELFPATNGQFRVLRSRLEQVGNFGTIGKQLLDCVQLCWVSDSPPSASELVSRLLDTVTETEL